MLDSRLMSNVNIHRDHIMILIIIKSFLCFDWFMTKQNITFFTVVSVTREIWVCNLPSGVESAVDTPCSWRVESWEA